MRESLYCYSFSIIFFIGFAYDIENDRDFMTWMWLFSSIIFFVIGFKLWLFYKIRNK